MAPFLDAKTQLLIQEINQAATDLSSSTFQNDQALNRLHTAANELAGTFDSPLDGIRKIGFQAQILPIVRIAVEGGWFDALALEDSPKNAADLARATGAEELLIVRLMRPLTAAGIVGEEGPQRYSSTAVTKALTNPKVYHGIKHFADEGLPIWAELPKYFAKNGYQMPRDSTSPPFVDKFGMIQWEYFKQNPVRGHSFNIFMEGHREGQKSFLDAYPADARLQIEEKIDDETVFLVDIGGGKGHDVRDVANRMGMEYGRIILEDLPEVIAQVKGLSPIETVAYDFFTPQPIKGARAYYLRDILHDWDDHSCQRILANQASAMKNGYSKLLLNEIVVPETKASPAVAGMDILMMSLFASMERTKEQWQNLLESSGFRLIKIWQVSVDAESIIEAELK